jgi:hypothetical protein
MEHLLFQKVELTSEYISVCIALPQLGYQTAYFIGSRLQVMMYESKIEVIQKFIGKIYVTQYPLACHRRQTK